MGWVLAAIAGLSSFFSAFVASHASALAYQLTTKVPPPCLRDNLHSLTP